MDVSVTYVGQDYVPMAACQPGHTGHWTSNLLHLPTHSRLLHSFNKPVLQTGDTDSNKTHLVLARLRIVVSRTETVFVDFGVSF
jgi:hypothetical protein